MAKLGLWANLRAKAGKEQQLEDFLKAAAPMAQREPATRTWYAIKMAPGEFGIFDTFDDEPGREAHLNGEIAKALFTQGRELLDGDPHVEKIEILASKIVG